MKKKIISIVGARPQFIKAAGLSKNLRHQFREILVHTGQHYDYEMSQVFFDGLDIPKPDYNLNVRSLSHAEQTAKIMIDLEPIIVKEKPCAILVYGDTNSTLAGALVASKLGIPLIHVEAGLRSFDKSMPEESNRVVTDHLADINFCPNETALRNLKNEGVEKDVYIVGNLMQEVLMHYRVRAKKLQASLLAKYGIERGQYLYATIHRQSNTDNATILENIVRSFIESKHQIIWPLHPRTEKQLRKYGLLSRIKKSPNIKLLTPVSYFESIALQEGSRLVVTDSGGVQSEAYWLGVPCVTLRDTTEWPETVRSGANTLVDPVRKDIIQIIQGIKPIQKRSTVIPEVSHKITKILSELF